MLIFNDKISQIGYTQHSINFYAKYKLKRQQRENQAAGNQSQELEKNNSVLRKKNTITQHWFFVWTFLYL